MTGTPFTYLTLFLAKSQEIICQIEDTLKIKSYNSVDSSQGFFLDVLRKYHFSLVHLSYKICFV